MGRCAWDCARHHRFTTRSTAQDQDDPPGRVARLGYLQGSVSFQPAGETDWVGAVPNRPMSTGDQLWTDENSRAEVQLGSAVIRLAPLTTFSFLNSMTIRFRSSSPRARSTLRCGGCGTRRISRSTRPTRRLTFSSPGIIAWRRVPTEVTRSSASATAKAKPRAEARLRCTAGREPHSAEPTRSTPMSSRFTIPTNSIHWSEGRDHRYDFSRSAQYLSRDVVGFDDLDDYGDWRDDSSYGHVWFPNQVVTDGRLITKAIGIGFLPGDGLGWMILRGATRRSTTDAG